MTGPSLLSHLDAPIVVGDPDGRAAYINPAFEAVFSVESEVVSGQPLASLFEGGTREAVLHSVAEACDRGENVRFRIRHGDAGFSAVASPIVAEDTRVGVVILMVEAATSDERFLTLYRQIAEPLDALVKILYDIMGQIESQRIRSVISDGVKAIGMLRRWSDANYGVLACTRGAPSRSNFDPGKVVRDLSEELGMEFAEREVTLGVQAPSGLPPVSGEAACLQEALMLLLRDRLRTAPRGGTVEVAIRRSGSDAVLISITGEGPEEGAPGAESDDVLALIRDLGGTIRSSSDSTIGRNTAIRLDSV
jgi:hypothetical protein